MNTSLENEINTYKHLLQGYILLYFIIYSFIHLGRNGLQVHVDRIFREIYQTKRILYCIHTN